MRDRRQSARVLRSRDVAWRRFAARALVAGLLATAGATAAGAVTFVVNDNADATDGACTAAAGGCTLREAIAASAATPGRDTIAFDPSVFPQGTNTAIDLQSALPVLSDPAGTVVDGAGAGVLIGGTVPSALRFATAPGVALTKVTVANLAMFASGGPALDICAGVPPACDAALSDVVVRNVVVNSGTDGISLRGDVVANAQVLDSVVIFCSATGIRIRGDSGLTKARVEGCVARDNGGIGIDVNGGIGTNAAPTVVDSMAVYNTSIGLNVAGSDVTKAKIVNVVVAQNGAGIEVAAESDNLGTTVTNSVAALNDNVGLQLIGGSVIAGARLTGVAADANLIGMSLGPAQAVQLTRSSATVNTGAGIVVSEGASGGKITGVVAVANAATGLVLRGDGTVAQRVHAVGNGSNGVSIDSMGGGNVVEKSLADANDLHGISVTTGTPPNTVRKNVALGNALEDLFGDIAPCANTWADNVFRVGVEPCVQ